MKRIPEPELMDDPQHVAVYAETSLENGYWVFIRNFRKFFRELEPKDAILDLGCGPATLLLRLAHQFPHCEVHGVDGAAGMLKYGKLAVEREGLGDRVHLFHGKLPEDFYLPRERYEVVISNSFLHHLADPMHLWQAVKRFCLPGAAVLVIDLLRPDDLESAEHVIDTYVPDASPIFREDMLLSLQAAYTREEVSEQLQHAGLSETLTLTMASPFQLAIHGYLQHRC